MARDQNDQQQQRDVRRLVRRTVTREEVFECDVARDAPKAQADDSSTLEGAPLIPDGCRCVSTKVTVDEHHDDRDGSGEHADDDV